MLKAEVPKVKKLRPNAQLTVVIAFMTDGEDSQGNSPGTGLPYWETSLASLSAYLRTSPEMSGVESMVHALAFGARHDFAFLNRLRESAGTCAGGFQYAEPGDGAAILKQKLDAIVASSASPTVLTQVRLKVPGYDVNCGTILESSWKDGSEASQHLKNLQSFAHGCSKAILTVIVRSNNPNKASSETNSISAATSSSSNVDDSNTQSSSSSKIGNQEDQQISSPQVQEYSTSVGITYATDYYGFSMPPFPQNGSNSTVLYASDPYQFNFGPQPGMSLASSMYFDTSSSSNASVTDFGPQPGSSHLSHSFTETTSPATEENSGSVAQDAPSATVEATENNSENSNEKDSQIAARTVVAATPFGKIKSTDPLDSKEADIGAEYLEVEVFQIRQDHIEGGERAHKLKIRVDRIYSASDVAILQLEKIKSQMEELKREVSASVLSRANALDWPKYTSMISQFERIVNGSDTSKLLALGRTKRMKVSEAAEEVRELFSSVHAMLATASKGGMSTDQLARMAEVAHGAQFSKARRTRTMDARAGKNAEFITKEIENFKKLTINEDDLVDFVYSSPEASHRSSEETDVLLREWFCVLTQENWMDLLINEKDVIGFGIALRRPEFVIDDPTGLRILDISLTCVAKSAFEHVLTHKLIQAAKDAADPIQAKLAYLGGFGVEGKDLGVVVRGNANEPINAWLPLYINDAHWRAVSSQFKSITGFLVTTNALGYVYNQIDVYFMILATMIVRMKVASHRQLELAIQYLRTCIAIVEAGNKSRQKTFIKDFIAHPEKRLRDEMPNLLVLLGYTLCLSQDDIDECFPRKNDWTVFWLAIFGEITRRALDTCSRVAHLGNESATLFTNLISRLVDGYLEEQALSAENVEKLFSPETANASAPPAPPVLERKKETFAAFSDHRAPSSGPSNGNRSASEENSAKKAAEAKVQAQESLKQLMEKRKEISTQQGSNATGVWNAFWAQVDEEEAKQTEKPHHMQWASLRYTDDERVMPKRLQTASSGQSETEKKNQEKGSLLVSAQVSVAEGRIPSSRLRRHALLYGELFKNVPMEDEIEPENLNQVLLPPSLSYATTSSGASSSNATAEEKRAAATQKKEALVDTAEIKERTFQVEATLPTMLEAIQLCENVVSNFGQPTLEGLVNVMTFLRSWLSLQTLCGSFRNTLKQLDNNLGVAPVSWMIHFREDWERRPKMRNNFFAFLNFIDYESLPKVQSLVQRADTKFNLYNLARSSHTVQMLALRMMIAQNAHFPTNKDAREAIAAKKWVDPWTSNADEVLERYHKERVERLIKQAANAAQAAANLSLINECLSSKDIFQFLYLLTQIGTTRHVPELYNLIKAFAHTTAPARPLAALKLSIVLSGKFVDPESGVIVTIITGGEHVPSRPVLCALHRAWGGNAYAAVTDLINLTYVRYKPRR